MKTVIADQSDWGALVVTGEDRVRFLQGMVTANVEKLEPGQWVRCCILNVKGRVVSVVDLAARADDLLVLCEPSLAQKTFEVLDRHAIADDVAFERTELAMHRVWSDPEAVWTAPPVFEAATEPSPAAAVEARRVEAGLPRYGVDVSEENFPFESLLSRGIDYDKGCYIGQEPVARVHARGSAAKVMRGLAVAGDGAVAVGAVVAHPERPEAGVVTSAVVSPEFGSIALAYVHRSAWNSGGSVTVDGRDATVVELPFRH